MTTPISENRLQAAYELQKKNIKLISATKEISGYKAAVSTFAGQKSMGLSSLITGVLFAEGKIEDNQTIKINDFNLAKIETEIGFLINQEISSKITTENVSNYIEKILPVLEIPDITTAHSENISVDELIALNTFSSHYVAGKALPIKNMDPNSFVAKLYHNQKLINTGKATEAMNNQWEALTSAINQSIEHGYILKKGDLIITGALGNILLLETGFYKADYGDLGTVHITVE